MRFAAPASRTAPTEPHWRGLADAWRTSIVTALEDKASKESPLEHKLVRFLMGDFVSAISELERPRAVVKTARTGSV